MKIREIVREDATAGGTSAGSVAAVVAPLGTKKKKKKTEMIRRGRYANSVSESTKKKVKESEDALPDPHRMAKVVLNAFKKKVPWSVKRSPEPYRAMMYRLGFKEQDGSPWWDAVMNAIEGVTENATAGGVSAGSIASSVRMPSTKIKRKKARK